MNSVEVCNPTGERLRGIIIGLGHQGLEHAQTIHAHPDAKIVGAVDPDVRAQAVFQKMLPELAVPVGGNATEVLGELQQTPDFAVVAVPHDEYLKIIKELCERQIPFLKEKPFARDKAEAHEIMGIPNIEQLCFTAAKRQYGQLNSAMHRLLSVSANPRSFYYVYTLGRAQANEGWRNSRAQAGGGSVIDMGYHVLSRVCDWFGAPDHIQAVLGVGKKRLEINETEDWAYLFLNYNSNLFGWIALTPASQHKEEQFSVTLPGGFVAGSTNEATHYTHLGLPVFSLGSQTEDLAIAQLSHFLNKVHSGESFVDNQKHHLMVVDLIDRFYQTANSPATILPEHRWRF